MQSCRAWAWCWWLCCPRCPLPQQQAPWCWWPSAPPKWVRGLCSSNPCYVGMEQLMSEAVATLLSSVPFATAAGSMVLEAKRSVKVGACPVFACDPSQWHMRVVDRHICEYVLVALISSVPFATAAGSLVLLATHLAKVGACPVHAQAGHAAVDLRLDQAKRGNALLGSS